MGGSIRSMTWQATALAAVLTLGLTAQAHAQTLVDEAPPPELAASIAASTAAAEAGGTGPLKAVMVAEPSLPTHTVYRPRHLPKAKLPVVAWGNGACTNIGNRFRYYLTEIASHGYVVIAVGPIGPKVAEWKVNLNPTAGPPPEGVPAASQASQLTDAINWAIAQNADPRSAYYHRLDISKIAVMGQSCGGLQAIAAGADPRVSTVMVMNSGTFPEGSKPLAGTGGAVKASLKALHSPLAYISGDETDIAFKNANADFDAIQGLQVFRAWMHGVGHSDAYRRPLGGPFAPVATAWLDWKLKGSTAASHMFVGEPCGLCKDPRWVVSRKGF